MPEIIDLVFAKTSQNARFILSENERFGLVFVKTGSINSVTVQLTQSQNLTYAGGHILIYDHCITPMLKLCEG